LRENSIAVELRSTHFGAKEMAQRIKNRGLRMRTAYCLDSLRKATGFGVGRLESRVRRNQYEKHGLPAPSPTTVRDYFLLRRCPAIDGTQEEQPSWLFAADLEFGGVARDFFHPIFDLLLDPIQSAPRWIVHMQRIPQVWIDQAAARGDRLQVQEWKAFNEALQPKRGRPRHQPVLDPLTLVHLAMLRLPKDCSAPLFGRTGIATTYARTYESIEEELSPLLAQCGTNALAALIGLVQEAAVIGDRKRASAAKQAVRDHLQIHGLVPALARVQDDFLHLLDSETGLGGEVRRYSTAEIIGSGFPVTWHSRMYQDILERDRNKHLERALRRRSRDGVNDESN
jgi:hypothetical protein